MTISLSKSLRRFNSRYKHHLTSAIPGLNSECMIEIMLTLEDNPKSFTQKEIGKMLDLDKSRVAVVIQKLVILQYVFTERNPDDRRAHFVSLTESGRKLLPVIKQAVADMDLALSQHLSETQLIQFHSTLWQITQNLSRKC
jgi:DNA-binding MarR family transcriptional regulator